MQNRANRFHGGLVLLAAILVSSPGAFDLTYQNYARFLDSYACPEGVVYSRIAGDPQIELITGEFASMRLEEFLKLPESDQIAFLINLYNFQAIALVVRHYPLKTGIRDISKPWETEFIPLFGRKVSLYHVGREMLRKSYDEPRVHFALNCAAAGSPRLRRSPYTGAELETQLDRAAKTFLTDTARNRVENGKLLLSPIFDWYGGDFRGKHGGFEAYAASILGLSGKIKIKFLDFDWSLNEAPPCTKERD